MDPTPAPPPETRQDPLSSPALSSTPHLVEALDKLRHADRLLVDAVVDLVGCLAEDIDEVARVGIEQWVAIVARQTRMDRRLLLRLCRRLARYPRLLDACRAGHVSFAQLRGIWLVIRDTTSAADDTVDRWLAATCDQLGPDADPDVLVDQARRAVDHAVPRDLEVRERSASAARYFALQPTLDGSGGKVSGFFDTAGLALLDEATAPRPNQRSDQRSLGQLRADNLLERVAHTCSPDRASDPQAGRPAHDGSRDIATDEALGADEVIGLTRPDGTLPPPKLLVRIELRSLLGKDQLPATVLTRLVGGRLWMTSAAARRLVEERGAELRSVVVDDVGSVVGVGRSSYVPTAWLRDATLAVHDACTEPCCDRPARGAQIDHARPWWPTGPDRPFGTTDITNLGPLCPTTNDTKEADGWQVTQTADGRRRWHHPATGLTVDTIPATWQPTGLDPPPPFHRHPETGSDPPATSSPCDDRCDDPARDDGRDPAHDDGHRHGHDSRERPHDRGDVSDEGDDDLPF